MFTGIIKDIGKLKEKKGSMYTFMTQSSLYQKVSVGDSIAVNGACLTVFRKLPPNIFFVNLMPETEKKTTLGRLQPNDTVNLELPATPKTFLSGHLAQGHVDGVGTIKNIRKHGNSRIMTISLLPKLASLIINKGSIAVNGISLTVIKTGKNFFTVGVIPFTWEHTIFKKAKVGDKVNIEVDAIGKYIHKFLKEEKYDSTT